MRLRISFAVAAFLLVAASASFAQGASASVGVGITVVAPITLAKTADLDFGSIAPSGSVGTVTMSTAGVRTATGGISLLSAPGSPGALSVTGQASATYAITVPASITVAGPGAATILVDGLSTSKAGNTSTLSGTGTDAFTLGGVAHIAAAQAAGGYAATFTVSVAYN